MLRICGEQSAKEQKMVKQDVDTGLPDPEHPEEELPTNNETGVILVTDEESDDQETLAIDQYQPLPMEDSGESGHESSSEDEDLEIQASGITAPPDVNLPPITPMEEILVKEVWSAPPPKDIEMDSNKVDEVKKAMANITLPPGAIPDWAETIPEEEWKQHLLNRLQNSEG
ncbi:unnamed protein product [Acanthoscelides obtectus]|uniref:Male-enhanced antigen 1 n=1 Tax=Acanthoscelides obtectus TaxID=200917 RepID=A0A9P0K192_ACAOB|nr:unnamed protein product [Acanthoscelides obtectus]CAK1625251.1 hypothetical protein AOBTE_LOCUS3059 [Acanthoscelides obtectus]